LFQYPITKKIKTIAHIVTKSSMTLDDRRYLKITIDD